jgi:hypothetical protein
MITSLIILVFGILLGVVVDRVVTAATEPDWET